MPTPTIPGGHGLPPAPTIDSSTNCLIPFTPSAGMHIFRKLMFSEPEPFGTHLTCELVPVLDELPVHDRQAVADVRAGVLARDRVHGVRAERVLDRRARGAVAQRVVDARRMQREVLADVARVDGDAGVLADEVASRCRRSRRCGGSSRARACRARTSRARAPPRARRAGPAGCPSAPRRRGAPRRPRPHAAARLWCRCSYARFLAAALPARRPKTTHSSNELPIMRLRPCVPPAISPHA